MADFTPKQQRFVEEYLIDLNASAAYRRAGYVAKGNAAEVNAARLLRNAKVASAVASAQAERSKRTSIDADWVLRRLNEEASADLADLYDDVGDLLPVKDWPLIWRQGLVQGVETVNERVGEDADGNPEYAQVRKVKLSDRFKRVEFIGKHVDVQAFKDRVDHDVNIHGEMADRIARARERAANRD